MLCYGSDDGSAPMDALMKIVEWMLLSHILILEIHWADNHKKSAPHELRSLPMRHLYLSSPAAHPVFITQRNWWQLVHFSFGSDADSMFFTACFNSSFIFYQYTVWAFVVGGSKGWRVPPHPRHSSRWLIGCTEILMLIIIYYNTYSSASTTFNPCFAAVASRRADRCVSLS